MISGFTSFSFANLQAYSIFKNIPSPYYCSLSLSLDFIFYPVNKRQNAFPKIHASLCPLPVSRIPSMQRLWNFWSLT